MSFLSFIKVLGVIKIIDIFYRMYKTVCRWQRTTSHLPERYGQGTWAVVTGGNSGIGFELCKELSHLGFNLVIVSRNQGRMDQASKEIKLLRPDTKIVTIEFDFSKCTSIEDYQSKILDYLVDFDVSLVFINAGQSNCGDFLNHKIETHREMFDTNVMPSLVLTKLFTHRFLEKREGKMSAIVFTGS